MFATIVAVLGLPPCSEDVQNQLKALDDHQDAIDCDEVIYEDPEDEEKICGTVACQRAMQAEYDIIPSDCQIVIPFFDIVITKASLKAQAKEMCNWDLE